MVTMGLHGNQITPTPYFSYNLPILRLKVVLLSIKRCDSYLISYLLLPYNQLSKIMIKKDTLGSWGNCVAYNLTGGRTHPGLLSGMQDSQDPPPV